MTPGFAKNTQSRAYDRDHGGGQTAMGADSPAGNCLPGLVDEEEHSSKLLQRDAVTDGRFFPQVSGVTTRCLVRDNSVTTNASSDASAEFVAEDKTA